MQSTSATAVQSPSIRFFSIPELIEHLGRFLHPPITILRCATTSRLTYQVLTPIFWTRLDFSDTVQAGRLSRSMDAHRALYRNMRYVEELRVQTGFLMHVVDCMAHQEGNDLLLLDSTTPATSTTITTAAATTSLLHTHHTTEAFTYPTTSGLFQLTWLLVLNRSSLTYVRLHDCDIRAPLDVIILAHALSNLPSLKDLDLKFKACLVRWKHVVRTLFYNLPVSIEALSLDSARNITGASRISSRANHPETGLPLTKRNRPLLRLKRLRILFGRWEDTRLLTDFVEDCPALESFTPPLFGNSGARLILMALAPAIVRHCPQLRNLDSCGLGSITIINTMPHHTLHSIGDGGHCMRWDVHAIMMRISTTQFSSLREIQIEKCAHVKGSAIQAVLWSCVALEVLVVRGGSAAATRLKHLVEREWTCTRLKRLEITVDLRRVETPAFVLAQTGRKMLTANNEMWEMLRRFYR
ncbi:hypothetical protein K457DRAFT_24957 [Linnemannia elongata AG-77]|uniref:F-box domain-containing protein n=1 Tax=Linnemannia elongata AG-77 TaxID=1314771 RepID=A0A197JGE7_9FUNG|nr:hypothetical protein K457DRAFT_24957 [Linnemannia elongata AG-77]